MTTSFLFWNVNRNRIPKIIADAALFNNIDVLLLAENAIEPAELLRSLNSDTSATYHYAPGQCDRVAVFTRFKRSYIEPVDEGSYFTARHLQLPGLLNILLVVVHFPSKLRWRDISQAMECTALANDIVRAEQKIGHRRTLLAGDMNMNPFEAGIVSAHGLNAVMTRALAAKETRVVQSRPYPYFYNPMWGLFGDLSSGPPGTYYRSASGEASLFWNMFDQVLIRPALVDRFLADRLVILEEVGEQSLLSSSGLPKKGAASDHLPLMWAVSL